MNEQIEKNQGYRLCSDEYLQFLRAIGGYYQSPEAMLRAITKELPALAEALHLGYLNVHFETQDTPFTLQEKDVDFELYKSDYDSSKKVKTDFVTVEKGICVMTIAPKRNYSWSTEEIDQMRFLLENLFIRLGYVRIGLLLSKAITSDFLTTAMNTRGMTVYGMELQKKGDLAKYNGFYLNLKNFKYINKSAGQEKGNEILMKYCCTLQGFMLPGEKLSRPGGDNFFALIRKERTEIFLKFLKEVPITVPYDDGQRTYRISTNVGAYEIQEQDKISSVMELSMVAMNEVKHSQKAIDQLWYAPYMMEKIMHDKQISQLFPKVLADGEFLVYYQPKVTLETKELCGCEALARWHHQGKIVPPMEFIPILEREGTVCNLDFYVFEKVCADLRKWLDMGIEPVRVSVNFSQQHLGNSSLSEEILAIMQKYDISSKYIEIELTEMSGAKDHDAMLAFLQKMREYGIYTSIDDFGTGFSSLNMLREFHMDVIKLDKSFVDKIAAQNEDNSGDKIVIENIVHMVQDLQLEIISEGVETKEQADFLKKIHCNMAQGYLFDKPLPHDEFEKRLLGNRVYPV